MLGAKALVREFRTKVAALPVLRTETNKDGNTVIIMPIPPTILQSLAQGGSDGIGDETACHQCGFHSVYQLGDIALGEQSRLNG